MEYISKKKDGIELVRLELTTVTVTKSAALGRPKAHT